MSANVTVIGNLAADPDLKFTAKGTSVCNFKVITSRSTKDAHGAWKDVDITGWPCTAWGSLGEVIAAQVHKGDPVIIVGVLAEKMWTSKEGEEKSRMELNVKELGFRLKKGYKDELPEEKTEPVGDPWATPAPF